MDGRRRVGNTEGDLVGLVDGSGVIMQLVATGSWTRRCVVGWFLSHD